MNHENIHPLTRALDDENHFQIFLKMHDSTFTINEVIGVFSSLIALEKKSFIPILLRGISNQKVKKGLMLKIVCYGTEHDQEKLFALRAFTATEFYGMFIDISDDKKNTIYNNTKIKVLKDLKTLSEKVKHIKTRQSKKNDEEEKNKSFEKFKKDWVNQLHTGAGIRIDQHMLDNEIGDELEYIPNEPSFPEESSFSKEDEEIMYNIDIPDQSSNHTQNKTFYKKPAIGNYNMEPILDLNESNTDLGLYTDFNKKSEAEHFDDFNNIMDGVLEDDDRRGNSLIDVIDDDKSSHKLKQKTSVSQHFDNFNNIMDEVLEDDKVYDNSLSDKVEQRNKINYEPIMDINNDESYDYGNEIEADFNNLNEPSLMNPSDDDPVNDKLFGYKTEMETEAKSNFWDSEKNMEKLSESLQKNNLGSDVSLTK